MVSWAKDAVQWEGMGKRWRRDKGKEWQYIAQCCITHNITIIQQETLELSKYSTQVCHKAVQMHFDKIPTTL